MAEVRKDIGGGNNDYSTIAGWADDLDDALVYSSGDDPTGYGFDDGGAFDENDVAIPAPVAGVTSITLTCDAAERHDGTAGNGFRMLPTASGSGVDFFEIAADISGGVRIEWMDWDCNGTLKNAGALPTGGAGQIVELRGILYHDNSGADAQPPIILANDARDYRVARCICYDLEQTAGGGQNCVAIGQDDSYTLVDNCTVDNIKANSGSGAGHCFSLSRNDIAGRTFRNLLGTRVTGSTSGTKEAFDLSTLVNATGATNASDDSSAPNAIAAEPVSAAVEYVSTVDGSEDYHLDSGAECIDAGTDLGTGIAQIDIDGRDVDAEGDTWDCGADELVAAAPGHTPFAVSRRTIQNSILVR